MRQKSRSFCCCCCCISSTHTKEKKKTPNFSFKISVFFDSAPSGFPSIQESSGYGEKAQLFLISKNKKKKKKFIYILRLNCFPTTITLQRERKKERESERLSSVSLHIIKKNVQGSLTLCVCVLCSSNSAGLRCYKSE